MNKTLRKAIIAGNWKMNNTPSQTTALINEMKPLVADADCEVVLCVPFVDVPAAVEAAKGSNIKIGAENVHFKDSGAFTGEVSADMLVELGVEYVVIGHSERRQIFKEDDELIHAKLVKALAKGMIPILCCGEALEEREEGNYIDFINDQIKSAFADVAEADAQKVIIAYEPIWAIGTGKVATSTQAEEVCSAIRNTIGELYSKETAENIHILYGGSCNAGNAKELFSMPNIDGGLIGGAGLKPEFIDIVHCKEN